MSNLARSFFAAPAADTAALQGIFTQQLAIMQTQLAMLGAAAVPAPGAVAAAPPAAGHNGQDGQKRNHENGQGGNGKNDHHADDGGSNGRDGLAAPPRRLSRVQAAADTEAAPNPKAAHGPHRPVSATMGLGGGFDARQQAAFDALVERFESSWPKARVIVLG